MSKKTIHPKILELCEKVTAKRPRTVIDHILKHGFISTDDLQTTYGYDHPPRAVRDVRENGIPLETFKVQSTRTGRSIAAYRFGNPDDIQNGRIGGRRAFPKSLKDALIERYGSRDAITGEQLEAKFLQIDHRIPYQVAGDHEFGEYNVDDFMLLDAQSQRQKSWICEHCPNWLKIKNPQTCKTCFWAFPEDYSHIATIDSRRAEIAWTGDEISSYERVKLAAKQKNVSVSDIIKEILKTTTL